MIIDIQEGISISGIKIPPGVLVRKFSPEKVPIDSRYMLIRANLTLNQTFLSKIPFIKSVALIATGDDNIDYVAVKDANIDFLHFPGYNANAVCDYVVQAIFLFVNSGKSLDKIGIIGKGRIGSLVFEMAKKFKLNIVWYDPFLKESDSLSSVLDSDLITVHVPLTSCGYYPTQRMITKELVGDSRGYWIQTSRGGIWGSPFESIIKTKKLWTVDVYPDEPPLPSQVYGIDYTTPHVAGYSNRGRILPVSLAIESLSGLPVEFELKGYSWLLADESRKFKKNISTFQKRRDFFPNRKEHRDYNQKDFNSFQTVFSKVPKSWINAVINLPMPK